MTPSEPRYYKDPLGYLATVQSNWSALTNREKEVATQVASGISDKDIGAILNMGYATVQSHKFNLYKKMNIHSKIELCTQLFRIGVIK